MPRMPGAEASEDASEDTTTITVVFVILVVAVALAAGTIGFMLGRCCSSMKPIEPAAKIKKDGEDTCIFHEKLPREGVRARSMPGRVLITKHGKKFHTSAECDGLRGATSKPKKYEACKVCARPMWSESSDANE